MAITKKGVAYHEAGHAVAAWACSMPFEHATINPNEDFLGHVMLCKFKRKFLDNVRFDRTPQTVDKAHKYILVLFAGSKAQQLAVKHYTHGAEEDYEHIRRLLESLTDHDDEKEFSAYYKWLSIRAENLVKLHWPEIEAIAEELLAKKTLTEKQVRDVISVSRRKPRGPVFFPKPLTTRQKEAAAAALRKGGW